MDIWQNNPNKQIRLHILLALCKYSLIWYMSLGFTVLKIYNAIAHYFCLCVCVSIHICIFWHDMMEIKSKQKYKYILVKLHLSNYGFLKYDLDPLALQSAVVFVTDVRGSQQDQFVLQLDWSHLRLLTQPLPLEYYLCLWFPWQELFSRAQFWEAMCGWGGACDWIHVTIWTLKILACAFEALLVFGHPMEKR